MIMARDAGAVIIVGAGLAGYNAAVQLRSLGHEGSLTIVDSEPNTYDRPPLSKRLFDEEFSLDQLSFVGEEELSAKRIETRFGVAVEALDAEARTVKLSDGTVLHADTVLLTTGGRARRLPIPGSDLSGISVLRTFSDALLLRESVSPGTRVAVVGAGLIGAELASSLRDAGAEVTLIDPVETPLVPAVGELIAQRLHAMHAPRGIRVVTGMTSEFAQTSDGLEVRLADGARVPADLVVVGVGIIPNVEIAVDAGIDTDNGVLVDSNYETSAAGIFAAGDVARQRDEHGELSRREEHWEAAQVSGQHAAYGMLEMEIPHRGTSWFWSDRHGCHLEATGRLFGDGELVVREGSDHPAVFLVEDGLLCGAASIDNTQLVRAARRIIDQQIPVTTETLADPTVSLRSLLRAAR